MNTCGHNWGDVKIDEGELQFSINGQQVFGFHMNRVAQSVMQGKSEVSLELEERDNDPSGDTLVEMKFWVPDETRHEEDEEADEEISNAMRFHRMLAESAETGDKGKTICEFPEWNVQVPRGRYAVKFYPTYASFHGRTFTHKVFYKSVTKMFLLQTVDFQHHLFVLGVDPPVRQGRTSYHFVVIQFNSEDQTSTAINLEDETIREEFGESLPESLDGYTYDVAAKLFKGVTKKKQVIVSGSYKNSKDQPAVYCSYKAQEGYLYILEKSIFFLKKPAIYIRNDQITSIEFARLQNMQGAKSFDLVVGVQGSEESHVFAGIARADQPSLLKSFEEKKLPIINLKAARALVTKTGRFTTAANMNEDDPYKGKLDEELDEEDSEDDEEFKANSESSDGEGEGDEGDESMAEEAPTDEEMEPATELKLPRKRKQPEADAPKKREKGEKAKRKPKDKSAPKKAMNAFFIYSQKNRAEVKAANPDLKPQEIGSKMGALWAALAPEAKVEYEQQAKADKQRYEEEMKTYVPPERGDESEGEGGKKKKREKKEKKPGPKKAASAWQFFVTKYQSELQATEPTLSFVERGKKVAEKWKTLTAEEKEPFNAMAAEAKTKYASEKAEFDEKSKESNEQRKAEKAKRKEEKRARREARKAEGGEDETPESKEERRKRKAERKEKKRIKKEKKAKKKEKGESGNMSDE